MAKSIPALVTPEILLWARNLDRISLDEAAAKMKVDINRLKAWENGTEKPTLRQAKDLAKFYRVPFIYFYLPDTPKKAKRIEQIDYRTFGNTGSVFEMSRELRWTLRDIEDRRDTMIELYDINGQKAISFSAQKINSTEASVVANHIRSLLDITIEKQVKFRKPEDFLMYCINKLEEIDVLVFQAAKVDPYEMRGSSLGYDEFPIILLNRKDEPSARLFTLMHELAHLVLGMSAVCNDISEKGISNNKIELLCNSIAGLTLVPPGEIKKHKIIAKIKDFGLQENFVSAIARDFAVSKEVILHHLWSEKIITKQQYFDTLEVYTQNYLAYKAKKKGGFLPPALDKGTQVGKLYIKTVFSSYHSEKISTRDVSNYLLNLNPQHFSKIEGWCFK